MITSQEINAMISMQQQQAGYMGGVPMAVPMSGASQYPPQFSYAPKPYGAARVGQAAAGGLLNSVGPGAGGLSEMAFGITGAAGIAGMGAGFLGFTRAASALGAVESNAFLGGMSRLNPLNSMMMGGMAGVAEAGGMGSLLTGAGIRAGLAGAFGTAGLLHPVSIGAMAAAAPLMAMHKGAQQYSQTSAMIGAYNQFANPFAVAGRGFSETSMASMVSGMRSIQEANPFVSMRDMQQTMARFNEMGMNQGERDAEEFSRKFRAMAKTVTAMSKALGTTMDEASKIFTQMRGVGFYTGADVMQNTLLAGTMRGEGISGNTMLGAQAAGGGITRGAGLGTTPGAKAVGGVMAMLTGGRGAGALSNEEMMNITGAASPDQAIAQLSTTMAGSLTGFYMQTGVGQAMLAALGATNAHGEFTGGLDAAAIEDLRSGRIDINNLVSTGRSKVSTRNAALSFKTKGQDVAGALLAEGDPTAAIGAIMQSVAGDKFQDMDPENLITLLTERIQGLGRKEAEAMTKLYREGEKIRRESQRQIRQEMQAEIFATDVREHHSLEGYKRRVLGGVSDKFLSPLGQVGQDFTVAMGYAFQNASDSIFGVTRMGASDDLHREQYASILRGEGAGVVAGVGKTGFTDLGLTRKGLAGTLTANDVAGPTNAVEERVYQSAQQAMANGEIGKQMLLTGMSAKEVLAKQKIYGQDFMFHSDYSDFGRALSEGYSGVSAERVRELSAKAAAEQGATSIVKAVATAGSGPTSLKEIRAAQEAVLGENSSLVATMGVLGGIAGGVGVGLATGGTAALPAYALGIAGGAALGAGAEKLIGRPGQALDALMEIQGMGVASRLSQAGVGNQEFLSAVYRAQQSGRSLAELLPNVNLKGISATQAQAYAKWAEEHGQQDLSAEQLKRLVANQKQGQQVMDLSNLAYMAAASAESATGGYFGTASVGQKELMLLKGAAETGDLGTVQAAEQDLLNALQEGGIKEGDITEERYGALAKTLGTAVAHQRQIELTRSDEDLKKVLRTMGFSEEEISAADLSDREALKRNIADIDIRRGAELSGGGAFTSTTGEEAVKYYEALGRVNDQILRIQQNNERLEAKLEAIQPGGK